MVSLASHPFLIPSSPTPGGSWENDIWGPLGQSPLLSTLIRSGPNLGLHKASASWRWHLQSSPGRSAL